MAGQIRLNIQVAQTQSRAIQNVERDMENLIQTMNRIIETLRANGWEGDAADGFQSRYEEIKTKSLNQAVALFDEMHKNLDHYSQEMQRIDREVQGKLKGPNG